MIGEEATDVRTTDQEAHIMVLAVVTTGPETHAQAGTRNPLLSKVGFAKGRHGPVENQENPAASGPEEEDSENKN